jgi:hypothetical protein
MSLAMTWNGAKLNVEIEEYFNLPLLGQIDRKVVLAIDNCEFEWGCFGFAIR